jgi:hypothetical protein
VTFVSEEVARLTAEQSQVNPVSVYVPDLITRQKHDEVVEKLRQRYLQESNRLPSPKDDDADLERES